MKLIICVSDYWHHRQWYKLYAPEASNHNNKETSYNIEILTHSAIPQGSSGQNAAMEYVVKTVPVRVVGVLKRLKLHIDGICYFYLLKELLQFTKYRQVLCCDPALNRVQLLWLQIVPPTKEIIDWKWNHMLAQKLWEKIETDYLMSWLSTLGGGYSALGEEFSECAEVAGKISQRQLCIGVRLGDPFLQSRCLLYYSISLIQVGRLRSAKYIIRREHAFARANEEFDGRLVKMCQGIWMRLQYEYGRRLKSKVKATSSHQGRV